MKHCLLCLIHYMKQAKATNIQLLAILYLSHETLRNLVLVVPQGYLTFWKFLNVQLVSYSGTLI